MKRRNLIAGSSGAAGLSVMAKAAMANPPPFAREKMRLPYEWGKWKWQSVAISRTVRLVVSAPPESHPRDKYGSVRESFQVVGLNGACLMIETDTAFVSIMPMPEAPVWVQLCWSVLKGFDARVDHDAPRSVGVTCEHLYGVEAARTMRDKDWVFV